MIQYEITRPVLLDETGKQIASMLGLIANRVGSDIQSDCYWKVNYKDFYGKNTYESEIVQNNHAITNSGSWSSVPKSTTPTPGVGDHVLNNLDLYSIVPYVFDFSLDNLVYSGGAGTYTSTSDMRVVAINATVGCLEASNIGTITSTLSTTGTVVNQYEHVVTTQSGAQVLSPSFMHNYRMQIIDLEEGETITTTSTSSYSSGEFAQNVTLIFEVPGEWSSIDLVSMQGVWSGSSVVTKNYEYTVPVDGGGLYMGFAFCLPANVRYGTLQTPNIYINDTAITGNGQAKKTIDTVRSIMIAEQSLSEGDKIKLQIGAGNQHGALLGLFKLTV